MSEFIQPLVEHAPVIDSPLANLARLGSVALQGLVADASIFRRFWQREPALRNIRRQRHRLLLLRGWLDPAGVQDGRMADGAIDQQQDVEPFSRDHRRTSPVVVAAGSGNLRVIGNGVPARSSAGSVNGCGGSAAAGEAGSGGQRRLVVRGRLRLWLWR